jgi:TonB family protein
MRIEIASMLGAAMIGAQAPSFAPPRYDTGDLPATPVLAVSGGVVFLDVAVAADGEVSTVDVLRTTPPFTEALAAAVRGWHFSPATIDSAASPAHVFVAGMFAQPTLSGPTLGAPPSDVQAASDDVAFPTSTSPAMYPPRAIGDGTVLLELMIDADGLSAAPRIVASSPAFDQAATAAAATWFFRPARRNGQAVSSRVYLVFAFRPPIMGLR